MYLKTILWLKKTGACCLVAALSSVFVALPALVHAGEGIRIPANLCSWEVMGWRDLNGAERLTWSGLGWTMQTWHHDRSDSYPASYRKSWAELTGSEKLLAGRLGFNQETWDTEECPNYSTPLRQKAGISE